MTWLAMAAIALTMSIACLCGNCDVVHDDKITVRELTFGSMDALESAP